MDNIQAKIMAQVLYEVQSLLRGYLGSDNEGDILVHQAAHLAYAVHNEALAVMEGKDFNPQEAISKIQGVDGIFGINYFESQFSKFLSTDHP